MPKLKTTPEPFMAVSRLIRGYGVTPTVLCDLIDVSAPTARKRLRHPETFTIKELFQVARLMDIPFEEVRQNMKR